MTDDNIRPLRRSGAASATADERYKVGWHGVLTTGEQRFECEVVDISVGGAKLALRRPLPAGTPRCWLITDFLGPIPARPVWREGAKLGIGFASDAPIIHRLRHLLSADMGAAGHADRRGR